MIRKILEIIIKILTFIKKSLLYLIAGLVLGFLLLFSLDFYYSIRGFQYVKPQPEYLITIEEIKEEQESYFLLTIEADMRIGCVGTSNLVVYQSLFDDASLVIDLGGVYKRKTFGCIPAGPKRPQFRTSFFRKEKDAFNLIINFSGKTDKYKIEATIDRGSIVSSRRGEFSEIIAYRFNNKLEWKTEKYLKSY